MSHGMECQDIVMHSAEMKRLDWMDGIARKSNRKEWRGR